MLSFCSALLIKEQNEALKFNIQMVIQQDKSVTVDSRTPDPPPPKKKNIYKNEKMGKLPC